MGRNGNGSLNTNLAEHPVGEVQLKRVLMGILSRTSRPTRSELARELGISAATVSKAVAKLTNGGFLLEDPGSGSRDGKLRVVEDRLYVIGISVCAEEKRVVGCLTGLSGAVRFSRSRSIRDDSPSAVVAAVSRVIEDVARSMPAERIAGVGVTIGGHVDARQGRVVYSENFPKRKPWRNVPLASMLGDATGLRILLENDANALAIYHKWFGVGRQISDFVLAAVTKFGVGCGIVINGDLYRGARGNAGELGHVAVTGNKRKCRCHRKGCLETLTSSAARSLAERRDDDRELEIAGAAFGEVLGSAALGLDPERIVICGGSLVENQAFRVETTTSFALRSRLAPEVLSWQALSDQLLALSAAATLLADLPVSDAASPSDLTDHAASGA